MKLYIQIVLLALISIASNAQAACLLSVEQYVDVDISVRTETVKGMKQRLTLLQINADMDQMQQSDAYTLSNVQRVYDSVGCTPVEHSRYGVENDADIALYLAFSTHLQQAVQTVQNDFDTTAFAIRQFLPETVTSPTGVAANE